MRVGRVCLVLALAGLSGCATYVAHKIEHPDRLDSQVRETFRENLRQQGFTYEAIRTPEGVRITYWRGDPRSYAVKESMHASADGKRFAWHATLPDVDQATRPLPVKGSIVLLHPWEGEGAMLAIWAYRLAASGYVTVMPDLRSQGDSDNAAVGYGPREGKDIVSLVRSLRAAGRLPGPLFLLGMSYGGTVALFAAGELDDVGGVIALEPYGNAADVIRRAPSTGLFGPRWLGTVVPASSIEIAITRASKDLSVDLDHVDVAGAIAKKGRCTLIVRGANDSLLPAASLQALAASSPSAHYQELTGENHLSLPLRTDRLLPPLLEWMKLAPEASGSDCPSFSPLPPMQASRDSSAQGITGGT